MNIVEALKLSKHLEINGSQYYFDRVVYGLDVNILLADNWKPIIDKKTVKKKFYQAVFYCGDRKIYFITDYLFETPDSADRQALITSCKLVRFLVENPIEVEIEETK